MMPCSPRLPVMSPCMNAGKVTSFMKLASLELILPKIVSYTWVGKTGRHHFLSQHLSSEKGILTKLYTNQIDSKSIFRILVRCEAEKIRYGFRRGLAPLSQAFFAISQEVSARSRLGLSKKVKVLPYKKLKPGQQEVKTNMYSGMYTCTLWYIHHILWYRYHVQ